ncbi:hypothetical protein RhiirC2_775224 [Rhizophagus irregularis]|uniref:Uncharacterized protein n=1 Tax=Rhizophagus irregularis TaxID=588596 RepID=A0A2N1NJV0_9GLOM|nr:hypothetical protein RhiirC2_775224 [Rhizophagus irregularis]
MDHEFRKVRCLPLLAIFARLLFPVVIDNNLIVENLGDEIKKVLGRLNENRPKSLRIKPLRSLILVRKFAELEAERAELKARIVKLLRQAVEENKRRDAKVEELEQKNVELKASDTTELPDDQEGSIIDFEEEISDGSTNASEVVSAEDLVQSVRPKAEVKALIKLRHIPQVNRPPPPIAKLLRTISLDIQDKNNLVIVQRNADVCPSEIARDAIDDLCQIMKKWEEKLLAMYNQGLRRDRHYHSLTHLYYEGDRLKEGGNVGVENRLVLMAGKLGIVYLNEIERMVAYKNIRNSIAHKTKWDPVRNREKYRASLQCIDIATGTNAYIIIEKKELLISAVRKCANFLYN